MKIKRKVDSAPSVMEAIETLSTIADLDLEDFDSTQMLEQEGEESLEASLSRRVKLLEDSLNDSGRIKEIFGVILNYLKNFYKNENGLMTDPQTLEGIKGIMVLVGDAAKKIDRYASYFKYQKGSVTQLREYKQLNEFYRARIDQQIDQEVIGKWFSNLSEKKNETTELDGTERNLRAKVLDNTSHHNFVNLEAVKKDTEYELFFIRKEDGSHFFSPRLLRNIKLICDFSGGEKKDPLSEINRWVDQQMCHAAKKLISENHEQIEQFYREAFKFRHRDLVGALNKCLMALFLASNFQNLLEENGQERKSCQFYFKDFLLFLREALSSADYHKLIAYAHEKASSLSATLLELAHSLCRSLYLSLHRFEHFDVHLKELLDLSREGKGEQVKPLQLDRLVEDKYEALAKVLKFHARGPLTKLLDALLVGNYSAFEPFSQLNLPSQLYALGIGGQKVTNLHLPSPTIHEYIHRVSVLDEFKAFLRCAAVEFPPHKHLLINLQDRTSWREYARCLALEELRANEEMGKVLAVVSLAKETEFYHQQASYQHENHAHVFIEHLKEHLGGENSGYYFPSAIKSAIMTNFAEGVIAAIHRIFFYNKNTLLREHRLAFLEIFDLFLILKLIDIVKPTSFSLTCKDGVDLSAANNALFYFFIKCLSKESFQKEDWLEFDRILFTPAILIRERLVSKERFERMLAALKVIAFTYEELGPALFGRVIQEAFSLYYRMPIFEAHIMKVEH